MTIYQLECFIAVAEELNFSAAAARLFTTQPAITYQINALEKHLNARGIGTNKHYPTPIHLQGAYAELGLGRGALPLAEEISATELSLPMFYGMTDAQVQAVIDAVNEFEG